MSHDTSYDLLDLLPEPHRTVAKNRRADAARKAAAPEPTAMPADPCPTCADLDALRLEHEAWGVQLDAARRDRDAARAVFRDAVHMLAYIARAAGFDPNDPTVEPPAIVARVERLRARADALQARLDALTAPVEGVDVEEVLADADALSEAIEGGDHYERDALRERIVDAAPALAREVVALRAALGAAEGERDRLHDRIEGALSAALGDPVMSIHDGDGPTAPDLESLIKLAGQIRRERDELRLTLAAEGAT